MYFLLGKIFAYHKFEIIDCGLVNWLLIDRNLVKMMPLVVAVVINVAAIGYAVFLSCLLCIMIFYFCMDGCFPRWRK